ncbi:MAG: FtsW/RodA/SpoVE family cell cycle protein [Robiginitomaculum sp.]|nr:FtsW/RodA/SpoVE family cell cycle protein [Robiginitomaculum sp.]
MQHFLAPSGDGNSQTDRALEALTGGGIFGRGPGEGVIKWILPEAHTDYIFSVAVEEFGTLAALFIITLFSIILFRGFSSALRLTDQTEQLAVAGLSVLIGLQAAINIAVNLHISPPEGMTLPFLSYGGSSMLAMSITAGLLLAFTRRRPGAFE